MENINVTAPVITSDTTLGELLAMLGSVTKADKTPKTRMLREEAGEPIAAVPGCAVYANGYALYDNGSGRRKKPAVKRRIRRRSLYLSWTA